jgi:pSer/pThr/pTyr-binding forkhead associated (FHA) protein
MKLRLSIGTGPDSKLTFEHGGPVIRIGRDPGCDLVLEGKASDSVSRQHARIELSENGATVADTGSSNGTLLNGQRLETPARLHVGDVIQMGYTGAKLTVLELDLKKPAQAQTFAQGTKKATKQEMPAPVPAWKRPMVVAGAGAALLLLAVAILWAARVSKTKTMEGTLALENLPPGSLVLVDDTLRKNRLDDDRLFETSVEPGKKHRLEIRKAGFKTVGRDVEVESGGRTWVTVHLEPSEQPRKGPEGKPKIQDLPGSKPASVEDTSKEGPSEQVTEVGDYVSRENWVSVLLQHLGEGYPWAVLRPETRVSTGHTLVSLPGYRSLLVLDSGVQLTLWGNLPEFSPRPPAFESVVMLNAPSGGADADFTLDRGRAVLANHKRSSGPAKARVRFLNETWELTLPDANSEAALELWALPRWTTTAATAPGAAYLSLFSKGPIQVSTSAQTFALANGARLGWSSSEPSRYYRETLSALPDWWAKDPDPKSPEIQKALRSLLDWSDYLGGSNTQAAQRKGSSPSDETVLYTIKTRVEEMQDDPDNQDVGVFFLAALDVVEPLVDLLKSGKNSNVRGVTMDVLQNWLCWGGEHDRILTSILVKRGDSQDKAERIVHLLHYYPPEAIEQRQTYEELTNYLDDDNQVLRDLAFWRLSQLGNIGRLPEEARRIDYDPTWYREKRRQSVEQWKKLVAEGKMPLTPRQ